MKHLASTLVIVAAFASMGAYWITEDAALVSGALAELKFEKAPAASGVIGGPVRMRVTKDTLKYLESLLKDGKTIEVQNNGAVKILNAAK
jgi:hypothetical protein